MSAGVWIVLAVCAVALGVSWGLLIRAVRRCLDLEQQVARLKRQQHEVCAASFRATVPYLRRAQMPRGNQW